VVVVPAKHLEETGAQGEGGSLSGDYTQCGKTRAEGEEGSRSSEHTQREKEKGFSLQWGHEGRGRRRGLSHLSGLHPREQRTLHKDFQQWQSC